MIRHSLVWALLLSGLSAALAQEDPPSSPEAIQQEYQKRIKKEYLHGVYIPADLGDAFFRLNELIDEAYRKKFLQAEEMEAARKLHFSLGRWITYNWGFYGGSRLSHYLRQRYGLSYPDDMARFIIIAYHRSGHQKDLNLNELAQKFVDFRRENWQKELLESPVIHSEKIDSGKIPARAKTIRP
mgnify:CR=1 FL=1